MFFTTLFTHDGTHVKEKLQSKFCLVVSPARASDGDIKLGQFCSCEVFIFMNESGEYKEEVNWCDYRCDNVEK